MHCLLPKSKLDSDLPKMSAIVGPVFYPDSPYNRLVWSVGPTWKKHFGDIAISWVDFLLVSNRESNVNPPCGIKEYGVPSARSAASHPAFFNLLWLIWNLKRVPFLYEFQIASKTHLWIYKFGIYISIVQRSSYSLSFLRSRPY